MQRRGSAVVAVVARHGRIRFCVVSPLVGVVVTRIAENRIEAPRVFVVVVVGAAMSFLLRDRDTMDLICVWMLLSWRHWMAIVFFLVGEKHALERPNDRMNDPSSGCVNVGGSVDLLLLITFLEVFSLRFPIHRISQPFRNEPTDVLEASLFP